MFSPSKNKSRNGVRAISAPRCEINQCRNKGRGRSRKAVDCRRCRFRRFLVFLAEKRSSSGCATDGVRQPAVVRLGRFRRCRHLGISDAAPGARHCVAFASKEKRVFTETKKARHNSARVISLGRQNKTPIRHFNSATNCNLKNGKIGEKGALRECRRRDGSAHFFRADRRGESRDRALFGETASEKKAPFPFVFRDGERAESRPTGAPTHWRLRQAFECTRRRRSRWPPQQTHRSARVSRESTLESANIASPLLPLLRPSWRPVRRAISCWPPTVFVPFFFFVCFKFTWVWTCRRCSCDRCRVCESGVRRAESR